MFSKLKTGDIDRMVAEQFERQQRGVKFPSNSPACPQELCDAIQNGAPGMGRTR